MQTPQNVFLAAWLTFWFLALCITGPAFVFADEKSNWGKWLEAIQGGPWSLFSFLLGGAFLLIFDKTMEFFRESLGEKIQDLLILLKKGYAVLRGTGEMTYQLTATDRTRENVLGTIATAFPSPPTYSNGQLQATTYALEHVILMRWGRKAKFKGTIYGNTDTSSAWKAKMVGSGTYVGGGEGALMGTFYLQCECINDPKFNNPDRVAIEHDKWAVTYVFSSVPAGGPYQYKGHWLLCSRDNDYATRFGTITLHSDTSPALWNLIKMIVWD